MASFVGMDSGEVRAYAGRLRGQANALMSIISHIDGIVHQIGHNWQGPEATEFVGWWQQRHRPNLIHIQKDLAGLAQSADNNAAQQDAASDAGSQSTGRGGSVWHNQNTPEARALEARISEATHGMTPDQAAAWWDRQSPTQRAEYLATIPAFMATMPAFSRYMQDYAQTPDAVTGETGTLTVQGDIKVYSVSGGVTESVQKADYPDGESDVTISGGAFVAAAKGIKMGDAKGSVEVGVEGDKSVTYHFASAADAQAFYNEITKGASADPSGVKAVVDNISRATSNPNLHVTSTQYEAQLHGSVNLSAGDKTGSVSVDGSAGAAYIRDTTANTQTLVFSVDGQAAGQLGVAGASTTGDLSVAVVAGGGQHADVQQIVISGQYSDAVSHGTDTNNVTAGSGGSYSIAITPNAANEHNITVLLHDLSTGNTSGASSQLAQLSRDSTVVKQSYLSSSATSGFDHQVGFAFFKASATGTYQVASTVDTGTEIKPAGDSTPMDFPG